MRKEIVCYTEEKIDEILEDHSCPDCKGFIMDGECVCCSCYNTGVCPFYVSGYEWSLNMPYSIKCYDGKTIIVK